MQGCCEPTCGAVEILVFGLSNFAGSNHAFFSF